MVPFFGQDFMQQTPAAQHVMRKTLGRGGGTRRVKRKAKKAKAARRVKRKAKGGGGARKFVKGSAAAKQHMARLRKMRRK